jgi:ABC-type nitrate/sulfonate/bicarbonate transport system substrate-binding protein
MAKKGTVWQACTAAKVTRSFVYEYRKASPGFLLAWEDALEDYRDGLEAVADKRARRTSDRMLEVLLKANRPEKYKDRVEVQERHGILWDVPMPTPPTRKPGHPSPS